jgi:hypothetical protein
VILSVQLHTRGVPENVVVAGIRYTYDKGGASLMAYSPSLFLDVRAPAHPWAVTTGQRRQLPDLQPVDRLSGTGKCDPGAVGATIQRVSPDRDGRSATGAAVDRQNADTLPK